MSASPRRLAVKALQLHAAGAGPAKASAAVAGRAPVSVAGRTPVSPTWASSRQHGTASAAAASPPRLPTPPPGWEVYRVDDHGHEFSLAVHGTREEAAAQAAEFEARGHKQAYFVRQTAGGAPQGGHAGGFGVRPPPAAAARGQGSSPSRAFSTAAGATAGNASGARPALSPDDLAHAASQSAPGTPFTLSPSFVARYGDVKPPFGFNGLGEFVYATRYSRLRPNGSRERWFQTVERVVNGTYNMQRRWIEAQGLGWSPVRAQASAQRMYERIFTMKFLPPGRGLWAMGTPLTEQRGLYAALNNCAFVSTENLRDDPVRPFCFLMEASLLGVGVGFDTDGAGTVTVRGAQPTSPAAAGTTVAAHVIGDSREGWVESVAMLLAAHFDGLPRPAFDYSAVRPRGSPIKGFGGVASGPEVLRRLHGDIDGILGPLAGQPVTVTAIVDLMNAIGRCIVSGDVRQTAEIAFGDAESDEYIDLKDYDKNPHRAVWGWCSNNSVYARLGMRYDKVASRVVRNGEPGFAWLENMRAFGRMADPRTDKDARVKGGNPCLEQSLESYELCCLVEVFPSNHASLDDFLETLKYAYLYAKTVTLGPTHWPATNRVMLRNRRVGTSLSGLAQFTAARGLHELRTWCDAGYARLQALDARLSEWLTIPRSVKTTCIKPSGTVSLLAGATPGVHAPESRFYLRRVRVGRDHPVVGPLLAAGYDVQPAAEDPDRKVVVTFPVDAGQGIRTLDTLSMWEQLATAAFLQAHWADNQVSCTVTLDPATEGPQLPAALDIYQYQLKGISFLPRAPTHAYAQLPYEKVTEEAYRAALGRLRPLSLDGVGHTAAAMSAASASSADPHQAHPAGPDRFCDSSQCDVDLAPPAKTAAAAAVSKAPKSAAGL